jgi:DNA (cytosine-5)-methyltransferase 1
MTDLTAVSLFAGVGGFDLAMQRQGIKVTAAVEIDKKASEVLAQRFPETKLFNDVKEVTGEQLRATGFIPERGIITGGFPCQDLSIAGLRRGLAGERSGLFHEIIRLTDELRPQMLVLENVPGLLSSQRGKDMGIVITALVERGYGVCWRVLDSQNFGVPQRRRRVFIVASLGNHRQPVEILFERESSQWNLETLGKTRKKIANRAEESPRTFVKAKRAQTVDDDESWVEKETVPTLNAFDIGDTRTTSIILGGTQPNAGMQVDKSTTLTEAMGQGGGHVPILFQGNRVGDPRFYDDGISPTVMSRWGTGGNNVPLTYTKQSFGEYKELNVASTMSRRDYLDATDLIVEPVRAFNMRSDDKANNMTVYETEQTGSVTALQPSPLTHRSQTLITQENTTVRRLTPKECERLQGFPDDWTADQADSNRYKQMGNAVTVPVAEWIMKRVVRYSS